MKQGIDHCGEEEMAPLSPTDRGNQRRSLAPQDKDSAPQGLEIRKTSPKLISNNPRPNIKQGSAPDLNFTYTFITPFNLK